MDEVSSKEQEGQLVAADQLVAEEALAVPTGPMIRSQTKLLNQTVGLILSHLGQYNKEVIQTTLVCLAAQENW